MTGTNDRRIDHAGADGGDPDPAFRELPAQRLREADDAELAGAGGSVAVTVAGNSHTRDYAPATGAFAPLLLVALLVLQSVVVPLPSQPVLMAAGWRASAMLNPCRPL